MSRDSTVIPFRQPDAIDDPLTELAREGARRMLAQALIVEADAFVAQWKDLKLPDGRDRVVRHGHGPQRTIQTGVGPVEVRRAKVRDRGEPGAADKIRFSSSILPKWARRTKSLDALLPVLYLRGVSTGDFQEALAALLGKDAPNLSPAVIARLTAEWQADYDTWRKRDLSARRYVYVWADGVYLQARMEDAAECMLVLIGATPEGKKELVGFQTGVRESAQSWRELLIDIKERGLEIAPDLAVGDGALGFWKAIGQIFPPPGISGAGSMPLPPLTPTTPPSPPTLPSPPPPALLDRPFRRRPDQMAIGNDHTRSGIGEGPSDLDRIAFQVGSLAVVEDWREYGHGPHRAAFQLRAATKPIGWNSCSLGLGFLIEPIGQHRRVGDAKQVALAADGRKVARRQTVDEPPRCGDAEEAHERACGLGRISAARTAASG